MRKAAVASLLAFFAAPVLCAQAKDSGIVTITLQQCIWRAGDNPTWSSADLDEASSQPYSGWKFSLSEPRIWIRCHVQPMAPGEFDRPAVQVSLAAAYELFMNGAPIGRNGDLHSGFFSLDSIRIFPVPLPLAGNRSNLLSLRIVYRFASQVTTGGTQAPEIRLGGTQALRDNRAGVLVSLLPNSLISFVPLVMLGIAGLVLLGFSVPDRQHPEPILLGLSCVFVGLMMVNILCGSMMTNEPAWAYVGLYSLTATANMLAQTSFISRCPGNAFPSGSACLSAPGLSVRHGRWSSCCCPCNRPCAWIRSTIPSLTPARLLSWPFFSGVVR